ncbi:MAG: MIP/aquaporin family protein [Actinomycetota bacterium]
MREGDLGRRLFAEALGTGFLLIAIVGSGIMAQRLTDDAGVQLLANAIVTGAALAALISFLGPISGAHFNPVVTGVDRVLGGLSTALAVGYIAAQIVGATLGTIVANLMFSLPAIELSQTVRSGGGVWLGEVVATFGLVSLIFMMAGTRREGSIPLALGGYVAAAIWFTSSAGLANPAVTVGRMLTDTFTGIAPRSVPAFVAAQAIGAVLAPVSVLVLRPGVRDAAPEVVFDG